MTLDYLRFCGAEIAPQIPSLARLRVQVFRDWPYLYDGDSDYEARYLATYAQGDAVLVGAYSEATMMVGASTGMPLLQHDEALAKALQPWVPEPRHVFYCAESVLLAPYRGNGAGHRFFDQREAHARALGFIHSVFCAVVRPKEHPARPQGYQPLDPFWRSRGYQPLDGALTELRWRDVGDVEETPKSLQVWWRKL